MRNPPITDESVFLDATHSSVANHLVYRASQRGPPEEVSVRRRSTTDFGAPQRGLPEGVPAHRHSAIGGFAGGDNIFVEILSGRSDLEGECKILFSISPRIHFGLKTLSKSVSQKGKTV